MTTGAVWFAPIISRSHFTHTEAPAKPLGNYLQSRDRGVHSPGCLSHRTFMSIKLAHKHVSLLNQNLGSFYRIMQIGTQMWGLKLQNLQLSFYYKNVLGCTNLSSQQVRLAGSLLLPSQGEILKATWDVSGESDSVRRFHKTSHTRAEFLTAI